jgi:prepilin-type processing-associated H-X9-DG protein
MAVLMPALNAAKKQATMARCLTNHRSLTAGWIMYSDDNDGFLMSNGACYDDASDDSPWVHRPKDIAGNSLPQPAPETITDQDRYRGIQLGTMWPYVKDVDVYRCPGDNRRSTRRPPRDCFRSYSISYAFGPLREGNLQGRGGYQYYRKMLDVRNGPLYYVFVEEEHNGSSYGANEGGWHLPMGGSMNRLANPGSYAFYDPLASYHIKASTFGFADGHAEKRKWMDKRTLEFIRVNQADQSAHSGMTVSSPNNEDLRWIVRHFVSVKRVE